MKALIIAISILWTVEVKADELVEIWFPDGSVLTEKK